MSLTSRLGHLAAGVLGATATVVARRDLSPHLVSLSFEGASLRGASFSPGDKVKLAAPDGRLTSYTPRSWDAERGRAEVVFHLHGGGPTARWAGQAQAGQEVRWIGPARSLPPMPAGLRWAWFFGDETTLGLAGALTDRLDGVEVDGAIELDAADRGAVDALDLPLRAVRREGTHGEALRALAEAWSVPEGPGVVWLSGHAGTVVDLWRTLQARGVPRSQLVVKPYWSDRGKMHRKQVSRQLG